MKIRVAVITASDSGAAGNRKDESGPLIIKIVENLGGSVVSYCMLSDDKNLLCKRMSEIADRKEADLILTTGGTGFSKRDCMPEATNEVAERLVPGIPEAMRAYSMQFTGRAMLSRGAAGIRGETLIINLPGSPKAVKETLDFIYPHIVHGVEILTGNTANCAPAEKERGIASKPCIFAVCGIKNAGKTTYLERLVKKLTALSYQVAVIKHDGHDFEADRPDTDSSRLKNAGAYGVAVFSKEHFFIRKDHKNISEQELVHMFPESDIILVEGLKSSEHHKFEIIREGISDTISSNRKGLLGIITDIPGFSEDHVEIISFDNLARAVSIIINNMKAMRQELLWDK